MARQPPEVWRACNWLRLNFALHCTETTGLFDPNEWFRHQIGLEWAGARNGRSQDNQRGARVAQVPPPPLSCPTPCPSPGGGGWLGGPSLGQHKTFCYCSLCCCVGDCVVRHCHLYPLYSWQDILPTFAELVLHSTTMFTPGTNVMFIRSEGEPVLAQVVGYSEPGDAYRRISYEREGKTVLPLYSFVLQCDFCS